MSRQTTPDELELTDDELLDVVRNHATNRRSVMAALGVGALASLGTGTAAAKHEPPHTPHIDPYYGYASPDGNERLPRKLRPDHTVELHTDPGAIVDGDRTTMPFHFEPSGLRIDVGDVVEFSFESPEHSVTAYHGDQDRQQRVPDASVGFSSPIIGTGGLWLYRFDHPGTYDLVCSPHEFFGMNMRLVVGDPDDADYDGEFGPSAEVGPPRPPISRSTMNAIGIPTWPFPTAGEVLDTEALAVDDIAAAGSVSHTDVEADL